MEAGGTGCVSAMEALKAFSLCLSEADSSFSSSGVSNSTPLGTLKVLRLRQQLKQTKGYKRAKVSVTTPKLSHGRFGLMDATILRKFQNFTMFKPWDSLQTLPTPPLEKHLGGSLHRTGIVHDHLFIAFGGCSHCSGSIPQAF